MQRARLVLVLGTMLSVISCTQLPLDTASESEKLLRRDAEWAGLAAGKDVERLVSYWTDDAIVVAPGQPVMEGKAAIRAFVTSAFATPGFSIHWVSEKPTFSPDGRFAYMRGNNTITVPGPNGTLMTVAGHGITVWRLEPDGLWRCVVDIWNDAPHT